MSGCIAVQNNKSLIEIALPWPSQVLPCLFIFQHVHFQKSCWLNHIWHGSSLCSFSKQNGGPSHCSSGQGLCSGCGWCPGSQNYYVLALILVSKQWGSSILRRCFTSKNVPKITVFSLNIAHTHFPFGGENSVNSQRVGYLTKPIINKRPSPSPSSSARTNMDSGRARYVMSRGSNLRLQRIYFSDKLKNEFLSLFNNYAVWLTDGLSKEISLKKRNSLRNVPGISERKPGIFFSLSK